MNYDFIENLNVRMFVRSVIEHCDSLDEIRDIAMCLLSYAIVQKIDEVSKNGISDDL